MEKCGVIYVAMGHDLFLEEAVVSAGSVKQRQKDCHITLFTDRPQHHLCSLGLFDVVNSVVDSSAVATGWSAGLLNKIRCLARSPYERTLFLDTDTTVLTSDLLSLFATAGSHDVAMAEASDDDSFSRRYFGRPLFNSGVILYRRNSRTVRWLEQWIAQSEIYFRIAVEVPLRPLRALDHVPDPGVRRKLLGNDQISLAALLSPETNQCGLDAVTLDYSWNHRGSTAPERNREPIRIRHWPREPHETHIRNLTAVVTSVSASVPSSAGVFEPAQ
jgi:hypothetical protein